MPSMTKVLLPTINWPFCFRSRASDIFSSTQRWPEGGDPLWIINSPLNLDITSSPFKGYDCVVALIELNKLSSSVIAMLKKDIVSAVSKP